MVLIDFKIGTNISCLGIDNSDYKKICTYIAGI